MKRIVFIVAVLFLLALSNAYPFVPHAAAVTLLGVDVPCDPALSPSEAEGGCGFEAFIAFMKGIIDFLTKLVLPIAAAIIVWGGIVIMTAGGSEERVGKGKKIITTAVIGAAIALGAWLIINTVYLALTGKGI